MPIANQMDPDVSTGYATAAGPLADVIAGKRVAIVGCPHDTSTRLLRELDGLQAFARVVDLAAISSDPGAVRRYDLVVLGFATPAASMQAIASAPWVRSGVPLLAVAPAHVLTSLLAGMQVRAPQFMAEPWTDGELLIRAAAALWTVPPAAAPTRDLVLIADDDPSVTALLRVALESSGVACHVVNDGRQALSAARDRRPSAILLDVNMPGLSGFEVLSALRHEPACEAARIILLTGCEQEVDVLRGFGLGADDYIVKPFNPMEVVARVRRFLVACR